jgi:hypothetical protein
MKISNHGFKVREREATLTAGVALDFERKQYDVTVTCYGTDGTGRLELMLTAAEVASIIKAEERRKEVQATFDSRG